MKARIKATLPGYTGNMDDVVIYFNSKLNCMIARRKVTPSYIPPNSDISAMYEYARRIDLSKAFKEDCNRYITAYNSKNRRKGKALSSWPAIWMKMMKAFGKDYPDIDLNTLTREYVIEHDLPIRNLASAVERGYLEKVRGSEGMTAIG